MRRLTEGAKWSLLPESVKRRQLPPSTGSDRVCNAWPCYRVELIHVRSGEFYETGNGSFIAKFDSWICPDCAASYGNGFTQPNTERSTQND